MMLAFVRGATSFSTLGEIYVKALPDGEPVQLTHDRMNKMSPVFAPDGARIAYTVLDGGRWDTWLVPLVSGQAGPWLENASGLTWTAKDRLMFSAIKDKNIPHGHRHVPGEPARSTGCVRAGTWLWHGPPVVYSPDGKSALIVEMANGPWIPCRLVSMDGRSPARQIGPPNAGCTFAAWSPDGKWMYLSSSAGGRRSYLAATFSQRCA